MKEWNESGIRPIFSRHLGSSILLPRPENQSLQILRRTSSEGLAVCDGQSLVKIKSGSWFMCKE